VRAFVLQTGGGQQHPPRRGQRGLSRTEREEISRGIAAGESCRQIAARLGRAPSTVSRELARNGGRHRYRAQAADAAAFGRAQRPKPAKLVVQPRLRAVVEAKLALRWSPEQIAGWLPLAYPQDPVMRVSHETMPPSSTVVLDKPWAFRHPYRSWRRRCADPLRPPSFLRRLLACWYKTAASRFMAGGRSGGLPWPSLGSGGAAGRQLRLPRSRSGG
jgi:DNA-binding CsgD family transcriptional regulator